MLFFSIAVPSKVQNLGMRKFEQIFSLLSAEIMIFSAFKLKYSIFLNKIIISCSGNSNLRQKHR